MYVEKSGQDSVGRRTGTLDVDYCVLLWRGYYNLAVGQRRQTPAYVYMGNYGYYNCVYSLGNTLDENAHGQEKGKARRFLYGVF